MLLVRFGTTLLELLGPVRLSGVEGQLLVWLVSLRGCFPCRVGVGVTLPGIGLRVGSPLAVLVLVMPQLVQ
jgi:hypothetical protein